MIDCRQAATPEQVFRALSGGQPAASALSLRRPGSLKMDLFAGQWHHGVNHDFCLRGNSVHKVMDTDGLRDGMVEKSSRPTQTIASLIAPTTVTSGENGPAKVCAAGSAATREECAEGLLRDAVARKTHDAAWLNAASQRSPRLSTAINDGVKRSGPAGLPSDCRAVENRCGSWPAFRGRRQFHVKGQ